MEGWVRVSTRLHGWSLLCRDAHICTLFLSQYIFTLSLSHSLPPPLYSDLCTAFGKDVMKMVEVRPLINDLLTEGRRSKFNKTKTLATWATKELRKLKSQAW